MAMTDDDISISQLLSNGDAKKVEKSLTCQLAIIQPPLEDNPKVHKRRRRIVLADAKDAILGFIMRTKPLRLIEGDTYLVSDFRILNKAIIIHDNSSFNE